MEQRYDSRIPVIGVGEGSWPSLVQELRKLTDLTHETVQQRLNGTRKYGVAFEGWGCRNRNFTHYFTPQQVSYAYHLSADVMADLPTDGTSEFEQRAVIPFPNLVHRQIHVGVVARVGNAAAARASKSSRPHERTMAALTPGLANSTSSQPSRSGSCPYWIRLLPAHPP